MNRKEKQTNAQMLYNPRHLVQAALQDVVAARDQGGRETMTEGDEGGDVGVARVFCGLYFSYTVGSLLYFFQSNQCTSFAN
jgi:hypothetical protein